MPPDGPDDKAIRDKTATHGMRRTTWFGAFLVFCVFAACAIGIYYLSADARREINALATANADSTQWALAQSEVELLALLSETRRVDATQNEQVTNVRQRFDVFYSRIKTMRESSVLSALRDDGSTGAELAQTGDVLDSMIPTIDGPNDVLIAALPSIATQLEDLRPSIREVSLRGVTHFSRIADEQRARVTDALLRLGLLTFLLVAALTVAVLALIKSYRSATQDGRERAAAQKRLAVIVSTSLDAIIVVDLEGRVIEFNEAAEKIFGYTRAEILNQKMSDKIVPDKYHAAHETGMNRYIETREKRVVGQGRVQLEAKHKTGRVFPVELSISSAEGPDGEIFISYLRDISAHVAKQEELVKARDEAVAGERAKADLVAVMSHEMRTPLNGIVGALELLKTTDLDKTQSNMTDVMGTSAGMLLQHVNDVLDMSRLEAGAAETIKRPFDPVAVTSELLDSLKMSAKDRGNVLELKALSLDFNLVLGDPGKLRQILMNLIGNAIKFTKHGTITVEIERHTGESEWELRVIDEGLGISDADQEKIFEDFVTLDPSYTRAQEGTGLGLAIVRRLVAHLGGEIGVESAIGEGSVFWVKLPTNVIADANISGKIDPTSSNHSDKDQPSKPLSVLLVEDNAINRVVAKEMLARLGHSCIEAHNGLEAVELAKIRLFDAILMDISMPDLDGVAATKQIKAGGGANAETPIFAVTAHAMPADVERFTAAGMQDVLVKPIGLERLKALLNGQNASSLGNDDEIPLWDITIVSEAIDAVGVEEHEKLLTAFVAEMDEACESSLFSSEISDPQQVKAGVHKLAGSASILGATKLRHLLSDIEMKVSENDLAAATRLMASVASVWEKTLAGLRGIEL